MNLCDCTVGLQVLLFKVHTITTSAIIGTFENIH